MNEVSYNNSLNALLEILEIKDLSKIIIEYTSYCVACNYKHCKLKKKLKDNPYYDRY